jgi:cell wall-associated NlpC family hydrolase
VGTAKAEPAHITKAKEEAQALRAQIESLNNDLEMAMEDYLYAMARLEQLDKAIEENEALLARVEDDLGVVSDKFEDRLNAIYRQGEVGFWEALFTAESFSDLLNRVDFMLRLSRSDAEMLDKVSTYRAKVVDTQEKLDTDRATQKDMVAEAAEAKARVETRLAQRKEALRGKEQQIAQLEREEQERQARLAEEARIAAERARAEQEAARRAAAQAAQSRSSGGSQTNTSSKSNTPTTQAPARDVPRSAVGGSAVEIAMQYIGVPYRWAGSSPSTGFDCSGFTKYVYAQLGVYLPHSSRMQINSGTRVARADLQPGDLVFFGSPIHHVGMYVGNNNYIHAPYTGANVRINAMTRGDFAGACRLL